MGPGKWESGWKYRLYTIRQMEKVRMAASAVRQPGRERRAMMMGRSCVIDFDLKATLATPARGRDFRFSPMSESPPHRSRCYHDPIGGILLVSASPGTLVNSIWT